MQIHVECYSGHRSEEEPRTFHLGEKRIGIAEIQDRWIGPDDRYFKVLGDDGTLYILRHDEHRDLWEMTMFNYVAK